MGRTILPINVQELQTLVDELESKTQFSTRTALLEAIRTSSWAKKFPSPPSVSAISSRFKSGEVAPRTPPGKPGRPKGRKNTKNPIASSDKDLPVIPGEDKVVDSGVSEFEQDSSAREEANV